MKLIFLGPPGAGKGTHASLIAKAYELAHLSAGDCFRRNIKERTPLGAKAQSIIEKGELVPDDVVNDMMAAEIDRALQTHKGFILDGYPRTLNQAEALDALASQRGIEIDLAINFETDERIIVDRLSGRRIAPSTGKIYHVRNMPPKVEGVCDETGEKLVQRKDDQPGTIKNRLEVYHRETAPLIDYYRDKGILRDVDGNPGVGVIERNINPILESLKEKT
ncbi:MAG: adenylate kinase [Candidatus Omnitrophota bacterium]|nr:adenylate kinase [Candidatus Omnitrophota bacterium]